MSRNRAKGTTWESAIVDWLQKHGFWRVERRAMQGARDTGDIGGLPGVVIEAKSHATLTFSLWMKELTDEVDNASADAGFLCVKKKGKTSVGDAYWLVDPRSMPYLLRLIDDDQTRRREQ